MQRGLIIIITGWKVLQVILIFFCIFYVLNNDHILPLKQNNLFKNGIDRKCCEFQREILLWTGVVLESFLGGEFWAGLMQLRLEER